MKNMWLIEAWLKRISYSQTQPMQVSGYSVVTKLTSCSLTGLNLEALQVKQDDSPSSFLSVGFKYMAFNGKPASPGRGH